MSEPNEGPSAQVSNNVQQKQVVQQQRPDEDTEIRSRQDMEDAKEVAVAAFGCITKELCQNLNGQNVSLNAVSKVMEGFRRGIVQGLKPYLLPQKKDKRLSNNPYSRTQNKGPSNI